MQRHFSTRYTIVEAPAELPARSAGKRISQTGQNAARPRQFNQGAMPPLLPTAPASQNETGSKGVSPRKPETGPRGLGASKMPPLLQNKNGTLKALHCSHVVKVVGISNANSVAFVPGNVGQEHGRPPSPLTVATGTAIAVCFPRNASRQMVGAYGCLQGSKSDITMGHTIARKRGNAIKSVADT